MLETARTILRLPDDRDIDGYAEMWGDLEVVRFLGDGTTRTRDQIPQSIAKTRAHWDRYGIGLFSVVAKDDGRLLGRIGFLLWNPKTWKHSFDADPRGNRETELAWALARRDWGRGYAFEAAAAARDWARAEHGLQRQISLIDPTNTASIRVAEKLGAQLDREDPAIFAHPTLVYVHAR